MGLAVRLLLPAESGPAPKAPPSRARAGMGMGVENAVLFVSCFPLLPPDRLGAPSRASCTELGLELLWTG